MNGKLLINVDDFGFTEGVNKAVKELARLGTISATNVMANMPFAEQIQDVAVDFPALSLGVHINLTQGKPLSPPENVPSLVGPDGSFLPLRTLFRKALTSRVSKADCQREIEAQVKAVKGLLGDRVDHWNSHQGSHRIDPFFSAAHKVCHEHNIPAMRNNMHGFIVAADPLQISHPRLSSVSRFGLQRTVVETYYQRAARKSAQHFSLPDGILVYNGHGLSKLLELLAAQPVTAGRWEVECHPAVSVDGLWGTGLTQQRIDEYRVLSSDEFTQAVASGHIRIMGFSDL